jgi:hypothetical protein
MIKGLGVLQKLFQESREGVSGECCRDTIKSTEYIYCDDVGFVAILILEMPLNRTLSIT